MNTIAALRPTSLPYYDQPPCRQRPLHVLRVTQGQDTGLADACAVQRESANGGLTCLALPEHGDLATLQHVLGRHLQDCHVGVHLQVQGDEAFLWAMHGATIDAGLLDDEITLYLAAPGTRQVFCVHCATVQAASDAGTHTCCQCRVVLEIRAHFSRRLGAYIGVCADADQPYVQARP